MKSTHLPLKLGFILSPFCDFVSVKKSECVDRRDIDEISKETLSDNVAKVNKQEGDFFDRNLTRKKILCVTLSKNQ